MPSPLRSILAATDLKEGSDAVVRSAAIVAARSGAELHLLHSLEAPGAAEASTTLRRGFFAQIEAAEARLQEQVERTMPEGLRPASQEVIIYVAHRAIADRATDRSADLIVIGPHSGGPARAHFLGTTADRVIRTSGVPCLVVEEPLPDRIRSIGVPIELTDATATALETVMSWSVQIARERRDEGGGPPEIRLMHVGWTLEREDDPSMEERVIRPEMERMLKAAVARVAGAEVIPVTVEVIWSNRADETILQWAATSGIDMLAMDTSGPGGLKRVILGSVASRIAREAPKPVLLVHPAR